MLGCPARCTLLPDPQLAAVSEGARSAAGSVPSRHAHLNRISTAPLLPITAIWPVGQDRLTSARRCCMDKPQEGRRTGDALTARGLRRTIPQNRSELCSDSHNKGLRWQAHCTKLRVSEPPQPAAVGHK